MDKLGGVVGAEFDVEFLTVATDGVIVEAHPICLFGQGVAFGDQAEQFDLATGQFYRVGVARMKCRPRLLA